ncbi:ATP-binding protein [Litorisediminicola beolgyonensis]
MSSCPSRTTSRGRTRPFLCLRLPPDVTEVRNAVLAAEERLGQTDWPAQTLGLVALVLAEALNNVVEHALAGRSAGRIDLSLYFTDARLHCRIRDDGAPMPEGAIPVTTRPDLTQETQDLPEGGFGWFLIRELADEVAYTRRRGENQLDILFDPARLTDHMSD